LQQQFAVVAESGQRAAFFDIPVVNGQRFPDRAGFFGPGFPKVGKSAALFRD